MKRFLSLSLWPPSLWHVLVGLWSTSLTLVLLSLLGGTSLLSSLFGAASLALALEIAFFFLSGFFAVILWRLVPPPQKRLSKFLAFLPPLILFIIFLF